MDLPQRHRFAQEAVTEASKAPPDETFEQLRRDPFALLAEAAGYSDREHGQHHRSHAAGGDRRRPARAAAVGVLKKGP